MFDFDRYLGKKREERITYWARWVISSVSFILLFILVIDYGFTLDEGEYWVVNLLFHICWWFYLALYTLELLFRRRFIARRSIAMTAVIVAMMSITLFCRIFFPQSLFVSRPFICAVLAFASVIELSRGVVRMVNKRSNPALMLSGTFLVIIFAGALLLLLPNSTLPNVKLSVVDSLFVSTSAVCVTGLSPVDLSSTFTKSGEIIILLLIQVGALGVMTVTSFFTLFFMGETTLYSRMALKDIVGSDTFSSLISTLLYVFGFTVAIEAAGMFFIWLSIHGNIGMTATDEIFFALFHSISAFCNAGFSTMDGNLGNILLIEGHNSLYLTISLLVIFGGIGFPVLVNIKNYILHYLRRFLRLYFDIGNNERRYGHILTLNTKIVICSTLFLLIGGTISIALIEWNGAFAQMSVNGKVVHSFFNSVAPRTAGFNSVDLTSFSMYTIIVYTLLMWIGGASQSTAGGIKVNTIMVAGANFLSILKGREHTVLFKREISLQSVRRAGAIIFGSLGTIVLFWILLLVCEPQTRAYRLLFEVISAISTVGSSLDVTPSLSTAGKIIVSILMFVGRVGLITVLMSLIQNKGEHFYKFPTENVIIN